VKGAFDKMDALVETLSSRVSDLQAAAERAAGEQGLESHARMLAEQVVPAMAAVREICDRIEETVADEFWTLPKYREMLSLV
jgi:glutamine synthetase